MSEPEDDLQDIEYHVSFDEEEADVDALLLKLGRIQKAIARREPRFLAAVEVYNAAIAAAFDQFGEATDEYLRFQDTAEEVCTAISFEVRRRSEEQEEEDPEWDESDEGRRVGKWLDLWDDFDQKLQPLTISPPERIKPPRVPLSQMIADLPRRPADIASSEVPRAVADRPIDPKILASVADSWRRIDAWLAEHAPKLFPKMNEGATVARIAEAERDLGLELPDAVRASYTVHDGSGIMRLFPSGDYLTIEQMVGEFMMWKGILEESDLDSDYVEPVGPIQRVHFHPKWIPLTNNGGGDYTVIDLAPAEGGHVGQLVDFSHETGPEGVGAVGLAEYLSYLAHGLEAGAATIGEDTYLIWKEGEDWVRSGYDPALAPPRGGGTSRRYFEFSDGTSHKFWEVAREGSEMTTRWGKVGAKGQSKTKTFDSGEKAAAETAKIISQKVKEGYVEKSP